MAYNYRFQQSPNFTPGGLASSVWGRPRSIEIAVGHWWGDPNQNPSVQGVINWLCNPASQVSAHYVVSENEVIQLVREADAAWHARQANPFSIGIEINPNTSETTYRTVAQLVRELRQKYGNLPLQPHSQYVSTQCPGSVDLAKIDTYSREEDKPEWVRNLRPIQPVSLNVLVSQTPVIDMRDGATVIKYIPQGTAIDFKAMTNIGDHEYLISSYSADHGLPNGIRKWEVGVPMPTPEPIPEPPKPNDYENIEDIPDGTYYAQVDTKLVDFTNGGIVKSYSRGQEFNIATVTSFLGKRYLKTLWSTQHNKHQGIPAEDLALSPPPEVQIPPAETQPDIKELEERVKNLETFKNGWLEFLEWLKSIFNKK